MKRYVLTAVIGLAVLGVMWGRKPPEADHTVSQTEHLPRIEPSRPPQMLSQRETTIEENALDQTLATQEGEGRSLEDRQARFQALASKALRSKYEELELREILDERFVSQAFLILLDHSHTVDEGLLAVDILRESLRLDPNPDVIGELRRLVFDVSIFEIEDEDTFRQLAGDRIEMIVLLSRYTDRKALSQDLQETPLRKIAGLALGY